MKCLDGRDLVGPFWRLYREALLLHEKDVFYVLIDAGHVEARSCEHTRSVAPDSPGTCDSDLDLLNRSAPSQQRRIGRSTRLGVWADGCVGPTVGTLGLEALMEASQQ